MILPIEDDGVRPAGKPDKCFYCGEPKGAPHGKDCVIPERTVVVEMTIQYVRSVPANWTTSDIEFLLNYSSSCHDNEIRYIADQQEAIDESQEKARKSPDTSEAIPCTCERTSFKYIREATAEEMEQFGFNGGERVKKQRLLDHERSQRDADPKAGG